MTVLVSEIIGPIMLATLIFVCYAFVKSFSDPPTNALLRIAVISLGPVAFNAVLLIVLFFISIVLGPALQSCCGRFGSVMAGIAHGGALVGQIAFFELVRRPLARAPR